jgi:hypothetical protein
MFKKNKYQLFKKAISKQLAEFIMEQLFLKKQVFYTMRNNGLISPLDQSWGTIEDTQVEGAYAVYGDIACETLLIKLMPLIERKIKCKLIPTYSYARIYEKGNELKKHIDRFSCEISGTLFLGGDEWPIFIKNKKINLKQGDLLIYKGCELEHWREPFKKNTCVQTFFHYNEAGFPNAEVNKFDQRLSLGIPKLD